MLTSTVFFGPNQIERTLTTTGLGDVSEMDEPVCPGAGSSVLNIYEVCSNI
jgi:hypothetical protein